LARRLELFIREAKILSELEDDKIVKIYDAFWDDIGPCKHPDWVCKIVEGLLKIDSNQRIGHDQILKLLPISLNNIRVTKATDFNPEDLLTILLRVMPDAGIEINKDQAIKLATNELGIKRVGKNVRHEFTW